MRRFLRSNKGLVRAIDFQLALVVFLLVFVVIVGRIVLLYSPTFSTTESTLIDSERKVFGNSLLDSPGYPTNWDDYSVTPSSFGLADSQRESLSYSKISKINTRLPNYSLNYSQLENSLNFQHSFHIQIRPMIKLTLAVDYSYSNPDAELQVTANSSDISGIGIEAQIILYAVNFQNNEIQTKGGIANSSGLFITSFSFDSASGDQFILVGLASYLDVYQTYSIILAGGSIESENSENQNLISSQFSALTKANQSNSDVNVLSYLPDADPSDTALAFSFTFDTRIISDDSAFLPLSRAMDFDSDNNLFNTSIALSQSGISLILVVVSSENGFSLSYTTTAPPVDFGPVLSEDGGFSLLNQMDSTITTSQKTIRGVVMEVKIWIE